jgi:hypothetical protein
VTTLPWWDASTPTVHDWRNGSITCQLGGEAILCRNGHATVRVDGSGFALRR